MKRNLNIQILNIDGTPLVEPVIGVVDGKQVQTGVRPLTVATCAVTALLAAHEDERNLDGESKVSRFKLAQTIHDATGEIEIKAENVALLKSLIAKTYTALVVGRAWAVLEKELPRPVADIPVSEVVAGRT